MLPKRDIVERFKVSEDARTVNRQLAAAYLLASASYLFASDMEDTLAKWHLSLGEVKQSIGRLIKDYDRALSTVSPIVKGRDAEHYWADLDELRELVESWVGKAPGCDRIMAGAGEETIKTLA